MSNSRLLTKALALAALSGIAGVGSANAQYTNYFSNQVFSTATTSPLGGTFNGGTYSVANPNNAAITLYTGQPGSLPSGAGFPGNLNMLTLNSGGASTTITVSFSTPLTPADHIYVEDLDNSEVATFTFYDASSNVINTTNFRASAISTNFNGTFTLTKNSTNISMSGGAGLQSEPVLEIIPNVVVNSFTITFTNPNNGGFGVYFGRNIPILTQSLSTATITRGRSATLTYTLSGINNNPIYQLGFVNSLPSGWKIAGTPAVTGTLGTLTAPANGSSVTLSSVNNSFVSSSGITSATWTVDVSNADGQMNSSCSGNPVAFSNRSTNYTASSTVLSNNVSPVCFTVVAPLPLELSSFTAAPEACAAALRWETAYEAQLAAYEIERSQDGRGWTRIGSVQPGNKGLPQQYSFTDERAPQGALMYRLHILDMGGASNYSPVASLRTACPDGSGAFTIAPNPARTAFSCSFASVPAPAAQIQVQLSDLAGRKVATLNAASRSGAVAGFALPQLPAGLYLLQATVDGSPAGSGKLILQ